MSDLIRGSATGEHAAFARLYQLTRGKMRKTALRVSPASIDIDDILQEAYIKIWRHAGSFDPAKSSPISWMSVIVRNTAIDAARRSKMRTTEVEVATEVAAGCGDIDDFDYTSAQRIADAVLARLPDDRRQLLSLAYLDGRSRESLAQTFGAPTSTIKTWLRRTLDDVKTDCIALARHSSLGMALKGHGN